MLHAAIAALLLLVLALEALYGWRLQQRLQLHVTAQGNGEVTPLRLPVLATGQADLSAYTAMVQQPLFHESRKPQAPLPADSSVAIDNSGTLDEWRLVGIITHNQQPKALISHSAKTQKSQQLAVGQVIAGWTIQRILPDRVVLQRDGQSKTVLLRKPRVDATAIAPPLAKGGFPTAFPLPSTPTAPQPHDDE